MKNLPEYKIDQTNRIKLFEGSQVIGLEVVVECTKKMLRNRQGPYIVLLSSLVEMAIEALPIAYM